MWSSIARPLPAGYFSSGVGYALYDAFGQRQVSTMYSELNQYHVVMEVDPSSLQSPDALQHMYVKSSNGTEVPLSTFTRYEPNNTALAVNHQGQFPSVTLSFNLAPNMPLGNATQVIDKAKRDIGFPPNPRQFPGYGRGVSGFAGQRPLLILAALLTVYIVLGMLYESYIHPITILSTLPSAGVGAILALMLTGNELNVIALIGIILLIGIVKKNAIMMIDFALETERAGKSSVKRQSMKPAFFASVPL